MNKYFKHTMAAISGIACGMMMLGCSSSTSETKVKTADTPAAAIMEVIELKRGILKSSIQMPGELIAFQQVDIYAKENSFVKKLYVDVGSEVKQGQLLAVMEAPELNSRMLAASSRLKSQEALYIASKAGYERLVETSKTPGTIAPNDLDVALAKKNSDLAQYEAARAAYAEVTDTRNYLEIRAPFSGVISARNVNTGAYVGPSGKGSEFPMFILQEQKKLRLVISVPEAQTDYLHENDTITFGVNAFPNQKFTAHVARMAGALDQRLRSQRIEMDVDNPSKELLPGMVADVKISLTKKDSTFIVPKTAVVNSPERVFVVRFVNKKAEWVDVKTGRDTDGNIEIYGNLNAGDNLAKKASEEIRQGTTIGNTRLVDL